MMLPSGNISHVRSCLLTYLCNSPLVEVRNGRAPFRRSLLDFSYTSHIEASVLSEKMI
jgi:hypothetical protein